QVAVHDEDQIFQPLPRGEREGAQAFRLVGLSVSHEAPNARVALLDQSARFQITIEARLIDRVDRPQSHRDGRVFPEVGHQARMRIARKTVPARLAAEVIELFFGEAPFEERARVDCGRILPLVEHLGSARAMRRAAEEVVEPERVKAGGGSVGGEMSAESVEAMIGPRHHDGGVPPDQTADPALHVRIAGIGWLLFRTDGVDVARLRRGRHSHSEHARPLHELVEDVLRAGSPFPLDQAVERLDPLAGLLRIDVRKLLLELLEIHASIPRVAGLRAYPPNMDSGRAGSSLSGWIRHPTTVCGSTRGMSSPATVGEGNRAGKAASGAALFRDFPPLAERTDVPSKALRPGWKKENR